MQMNLFNLHCRELAPRRYHIPLADRHWKEFAVGRDSSNESNIKFEIGFILINFVKIWTPA